jgi:DNA repair protein SbcC/Rad50
MIPEELIIKGFTSYKSEQKINFNRLSSDKLFGIFGTVGSGKSSILDAISFVLYGEVDKLNKSEKRNYNLTNLSSKEFKIEFTFRKNKNRFKFISIGKRKKNNFDEVDIKSSSYIENESKWVENSKSAEDILGLNFSNFKKTIIIPQGKFQEFLQLSSTERSNLLKKLFNLDRFDLSEKTKYLEKETNQKLNLLDGSLLELNEYSNERLEQLKIDLEMNSDKFSKLKLDIEFNQKKITELESNLKILKEFNEHSKKLNEVEKTVPLYQDRKKRKELFDECNFQFKTLIFDLDKNRNLFNETNEKIQNLNGKIHILKKEESKIHQDYEKSEKDVQEKHSLISKNEEWKKTLSYKTEHEKFKEDKTELEKIQNQFVTINEKILKTEKIIDELNNSLKSKKENPIDLNDLYKESQSIEKNLEIFQRANSIQGEIIKKKSLKKELSFSIESIQQKYDASTYSKNEFLELLLIKKNESNKILLDAKVNLSTIVLNLQKELKIGDNCPVCQTKLIKLPDLLEHTEEHDKSIEEIEYKIKNLELDISQFEKLDFKFQTLETELQSKNDDIREYEEFLKSFDEKLNIDRKNIIRIEIDSKNKILKEIKELEKNLEDKNSILKNFQTELKKIQELKNNLNNSLIKSETILEKTRSEISNDVFDKLIQMENSKILETIKKQEIHIQEIDSLFQKLKTKKNEYEKEISKVHTILNESQELKVKLNTEINSIEESINKKLTDTLPSIEAIRNILHLSIDPIQESKEIEQFFSNYNKEKSIFIDLKNKIEKNPFSEEEYISIQAKNQDDNKLFDILQQEIGAIKSSIQQTESKIKIKIDLLKQREELSLRQEDLKELISLFSSQGFVNYVSYIFLADLCEAANERFYFFTGNKLRLELTKDNHFQVRDYFNNGEVRHIKTLSGGQLFQASLSMAIALSDRISKAAGEEESFFFLDEGFGSLDKDSLELVFQTLKSLHKENRIVGLISHVEEMKQEINTYLTIHNSESLGSIIKPNWE